MTDGSTTETTRLPAPMSGSISHDWVETIEGQALRCRACGAVAVHAADSGEWTYAMPSQPFGVEIPICRAADGWRPFEEDAAQIKELLWSMIGAKPEAIPEIERSLRYPAGHIRRLALLGTFDVPMILAVLHHFDVDPAEFFAKVFGPGSGSSDTLP